MYNQSLKFKLRAASIVTLVMIAVLTVYALNALGSIHNASNSLADQTQRAVNLGDLRSSLQAFSGSNFGILAADSDELEKSLVARQKKNIKDAEKYLQISKTQNADSTKATAILEDIEDSFEKLKQASSSQEIAQARDGAQRNAAIDRMSDARESLDAAARKLADLRSEQSEKSIKSVDSTFKTARLVQIILGAFVVLISGLIFFHLYKVIVPRLLAFVDRANKWADGDLTETAADFGRDCLTDLATALNKMILNWRVIAGDLQETSLLVGQSAEGILATAHQQHQSANEQAAAVTQTSAAADEVRASAEVAATQAAGVAEQAERSGEIGEQGSQAMQDVMSSMSNIREQVQGISADITALAQQTQQIEDITSTVSDLADQSNLLALNATIEAARAGEQGKGFAVVADEVRNLAEQSKQAVSQVQAILGEIQNATGAAVRNAESGSTTVADAVSQVETAGGIIDELITANLAAAQAAQQISASVQQQNIGMEEITRAMEDTKHASEQFVEGVNHSQQSAEDLTQIAQRLGEVAGKLKVDAAQS